MKKILFFVTIFSAIFGYTQVDYSDKWEGFFSYNNVKDFVKVEQKIYAITDNAVFIYDINTGESEKISSIQGLSGEQTSAVFYDTDYKRLVIGYENGLVEIVNENGSITVADDIKRLNIAGSKRINHISKYQNRLFVATPFAIIEYNIENLEFGDTFYIGTASSTVNINQTLVFNNTIFAATENGIYTADVTHPYLIDFNNWQQPIGNFTGNFTALTVFNNEVYASKNNSLYRLTSANTIQFVQNFNGNIINLNHSDDYLTVTTQNKSYILNTTLTLLDTANSFGEYNFKLKNSYAENGVVYLATNKYGILSRLVNDTEYLEIHPEGPLYNEIYSIDVNKGNLWVVYGAADYATYNLTGTRKGFSHYNGETWINIRYPDIGFEAVDLLNVAIDPFHENRVFISSNRNGLLEIENNIITNHYDHTNSPLEIWSGASPSFLPNGILLTSSAFDKQGNLWVSNAFSNDRINKLSTQNVWTTYSFGTVIPVSDKNGLGDVVIDNSGNKWLGSRSFGALVFNENGEKSAALTTEIGKGELPDDMVRSIAVDKNNTIWIGTIRGFRTFNGISRVFEEEIPKTRPVLIKLEGATGDEQAQIVLGEQSINAIAVDGADNKWFGTNTSGVLGTNPTAKKELYLFNKDNSPLPSNKINKIKVDNSNGKVYFATDNGLVAFKSEVAPFSDTLGETYAYPNPSTKENEFITIDGRNGTHLPRGTNVKILDSAGYLVYETNVVEGQELKGGKVTWNKRNLAGTKVASGVYIILLTLPDKSETSSTKVAIIR